MTPQRPPSGSRRPDAATEPPSAGQAGRFAWAAPLLAIHPSITGEEARRQARLLSFLLLFFSVLITLVVAVAPPLANPGVPHQGDPLFVVGASVVVAFLFTYALLRRGFAKTAQAIFVLAGVAGSWMVVLLGRDTPWEEGAPAFLLITVLLASLFWTPAQTAALAVFHVLAVLLYPIQPGTDVGTRAVIVIILAVFPPLIVAATQMRQNDLRRIQAQEAELARHAAALERAKLEAEAATRAKSQFLASMSHELRTPLNAVIGMAQLLREEALSPEQRDYVETMRTSGEHLLTLISDVLDFSKIESGTLELTCERVDVRTIAEEALGLVVARAAQKGLHLPLRAPTEMPAILGDPGRLRQILLNYLSNAVKFTESGTVELSLDLTPRDDGRLDLHVAVRDTGPGIHASELPRLFRSFSQVGELSRQAGGTGLGLAITKRLAERMGGRVWAESEFGRGSTFHATVIVEPAPALTGKEGDAAALAGRSALIVDDTPSNRLYLRSQLASWGMQVREASSGAEALALLQKGDDEVLPDIILTDEHMPGMTGAELALTIRKRWDGERLPILMTGSFGQVDQVARAAMQGFLLKPIRRASLHTALATLLTRSGAAAEATATLERRSILIAEDNPTNQRVAVALLRRLGQNPEVVQNGREAVERVARGGIELVLMDLNMPVLDGVEATREIRRRFGERPLVVAMTADALPEHRRDGLAAGMDGYITKPVRVEELRAAIQGIAAA